MRKFLVKVALFFAIQGAIVITILALGYRPSPAAYLAATHDKHQRLAAERKPRVLLVGGSNLAFGVNSIALSKNLDRPVVNLGLHAGLGLGFMLHEAEDVMRKGDLVVLSLEWEHFDKEMPGALLWELLAQRSASADYVSWDQAPPLLDSAAVALGRAMRASLARLRHREQEPQAPYRRDSFNARGDVVGHFDRPRPGPGKKGYFPGGYQGRKLGWAVASVEALVQKAKRRGVDVVVVFPPLIESAWPKAEPGITKVARAIEEGVSAPKLNKPKQLLPVTKFYDTPYHLVEEAIAWRTQRLTEDLRRHLHTQSPPASTTERR